MLLSLLSAAVLATTPPMVADRYELSFENRAQHEATIVARFDALPAGPLELRMARSSPGRYALHEFAKNVDDVRATDGSGKALEVERPDPYSWIVEGGHDGSVIVTYTLYGDRGDGTYAQIDPTHAHLNAPATFMIAPALTGRMVEVRLTAPEPDWKVATQLLPTADPMVFTAASRDYLLDSPIEFSNHELRSFSVSHKGERAEIRIAAHTNLSDAELDELEASVKAIVEEQLRFWDDMPDFEGGTYTFLVDMLPWVDGDGMEHRGSTVISVPRPDGTSGLPSLNVFSHEFFHAWSVERLRPSGLEPFDFLAADVTPHLWLAEGFDNHLDGILMGRAGVLDREGVLAGLAGAISWVRLSPARPGSSPSEMSRMAPFLDAATSNDPVNAINSQLSYYTYGAAVGLGLDLLLRTRFDKSLDDYMRALWQRYGKVEKPYTDSDLIDTLADVSGDRGFATRFFAETIHGDALPDYDAMLAEFGYRLQPRNPRLAWLDFVRPDFVEGRAMLDGNTMRGSTLYEAGLGRGDEVVAINGRAIDAMGDWIAAVSALVPGQTMTIDYARRGGATGRATVRVQADPMLEIVSVEAPTQVQLARRESWLGPNR